MTEAQVWLCIVLFFSGTCGAVGYHLGGLSKSEPVVIQPGGTPANYDPARAIVSDTLKQLQDANTACWNHVQQLIVEKGDLRRTKPATH